MAQSQHINSPKLDGIHIVLILAAVFAIGSVGFFLAILLGKTYAPRTSGSASQERQLTTAQKNSALENFSGGSSASSSGSASTSTGNVMSSQGSQSDETTANKLKALQSFSSQ